MKTITNSTLETTWLGFRFDASRLRWIGLVRMKARKHNRAN